MSDILNTETITVTIDPHKPLPTHNYGQDSQGEWHDGPVTLYDAIIQAAAAQLVGVGEKVLREVVEQEIKAAVVREIDARLPAIIEAAFAEDVETGDGWSSHKTTMRELIGERVKQQVRADRHGYNDSVLVKTMREHIDNALAKEFQEEIKAAKVAVRARVTAKAAELLAAESLSAVGIR